MNTNSLSFRLLLSSGLVLAAFFILVAWVLEKGFQKSTEQALKEKLQIHIYSLLSAAELSSRGHLKMPEDLHEPRFASPGSGLYAYITQANQQLVWRSRSALGFDLAPVTKYTPGKFDFYRDDSGWYKLHYAVIWEYEPVVERVYIFTVAEDAHAVAAQVSEFKKTLRAWLFGISLVSLLTQFMVLRWSLKPLRTIGKDLTAIEQGRKIRLQGHYAEELQGLAGNLNALINHERSHSERYRNTLANLAHSLKTPLTVLRSCVKSLDIPEDVRVTLQAQVSSMNTMVEYQLQRAAAKGKQQLTGQVDVTEVTGKIIAALDKVYADKQVRVLCLVNEPCRVYYSAGDIYEIAGNLLDNAYKWCKGQVSMDIQLRSEDEHSLVLQIEDDGPGIYEHQLDKILKRGVRADENIDGHGIGMAVVHELVEVLGGKLYGGKSETLGGMMWRVYLP